MSDQPQSRSGDDDDSTAEAADIAGGATDEAAAETAARRKYLADLEERGEAVPEGAELTPGATHELDGDDEDIVHRKRFSTY